MCTRYARPLASCLCTVTGSLSFRGIGHTETFPNVSNCARIPRVVKINIADPLPTVYSVPWPYLYLLWCERSINIVERKKKKKKKEKLATRREMIDLIAECMNSALGVRFTIPFRSAQTDSRSANWIAKCWNDTGGCEYSRAHRAAR